MDMEHNEEEISTVYLSNLPENATEREIRLLFRLTPGYDECFLKPTSGRACAWVSFDSHSTALQAIDEINGYEFEEGYRIQASLAKRNSRKRGAEGPADHDHPEKRRTTERPPPRPSSRAAPSAYPPRLPPRSYHTDPSPPRHHTEYPPRRERPAQASNTLYITCAEALEDEGILEALLETFRGFRRMKPGRGGRAFFAEYADPNLAAVVLASLQGRMLAGYNLLTVDFARSAMK